MTKQAKKGEGRQPCSTHRCRNRARRGGKCWTCRSREWRSSNPMQACFVTLRYNSKRRNIPFDLTFEDFKELCISTDYIKGKGKTKLSYSLDRINDDPEMGYHGYRKDNIGVIRLCDNSSKRNGKVIVDYQWDGTRMRATVTRKLPTTKEKVQDDLPF